jgi:molybdopterin-containing oxidoreductase family membrane subunit
VGVCATIFGVLLLGTWACLIYKGIGPLRSAEPGGLGVRHHQLRLLGSVSRTRARSSRLCCSCSGRSSDRASTARPKPMTVIAVMCAGMYPLITSAAVGSSSGSCRTRTSASCGPNFKSPLEWDVFAVSTYLTISVVFFYVGLIPDFAIVKRYTRGFSRHIYSALFAGLGGDRSGSGATTTCSTRCSAGYRGAAGAAPCTRSVSWDFAMGLVPGWHTTIFAPYFVAGAIFSGCGMVLDPVHSDAQDPAPRARDARSITSRKLAKTMLFTSMIVGYAYSHRIPARVLQRQCVRVRHLQGPRDRLLQVPVLGNGSSAT